MKLLAFILGFFSSFSDPSYFMPDTGDTGSDTDTDTDTDTTTDTNTDTDTTTDTNTSTDTAAGALQSATQLSGENGGFSCASVGMSGAVAFWGAVLLIGIRREE